MKMTCAECDKVMTEREAPHHFETTSHARFVGRVSFWDQWSSTRSFWFWTGWLTLAVLNLITKWLSAR